MKFDLKVLRRVVKAVTDKSSGGLTLGEILDRTAQHLQGKGQSLPKPWMVETTLGRFRDGDGDQSSRRIDALRAIWNCLADDEHFKHLFQVESPENIFIEGMTRLLRESTDTETTYDLYGRGKIGERFVGAYALYRRSWQGFAASTAHFTGEASISLLEISATPQGYRVSETQDFDDSDGRDPYSQFDRGCLASLGKFIYFLMKEQNGTSIKYGVIQNTLVSRSTAPIGWFSGILYASSNVAFYPPARFYCRRIPNLQDFKQRRVKMEEIPDLDAKVYLLEEPSTTPVRAGGGD